MRSSWNRSLTARVAMVALLAAVVWSPWAPQTARAAERQFLVTLAHSPKQVHPLCVVNDDCASGTCDGEIGWCVTPCNSDADCDELPGDNFCDVRSSSCEQRLPSAEAIRKQYFDVADPGIDSFAEYWEEISYGDVTISGQTTDWIALPWSITQPARFAWNQDGRDDLDGDALFTYGAGEVFAGGDTASTAVPCDEDADCYRVGLGDGFRCDATRHLCVVGVWRPGERYIDMNGNGRWDNLDEATNQMDSNPEDGIPDLAGPWIDLNEDTLAQNVTPCLYLPDADNDRNPDCCPDGPGTTGCEGYPDANACRATTWAGPGGTQIVDCNGNMIPDACDTSCFSAECLDTGWTGPCGTSSDRLPISEGDTACDVETADGIPDECQFANFNVPVCVQTAASAGSLCDGRPICEPITIVPLNRCEFVDFNRNGQLDTVEPFENFIRSVRNRFPTKVGYDKYIKDNYPGDADAVIAQSDVRTLWAPHDPEGLGRGDCICSDDGLPCRDVVDDTGRPVVGACRAGGHAVYDPPTSWTDVGSTKMVITGAAGTTGRYHTREPGWFEQAWRDRYGTEPPSWRWAGAPRTDPDQTRDAVSLDLTGRKPFGADRGGVVGDGTGWIGCGGLPTRGVVFSDGAPFELNCNARIMPEETAGFDPEIPRRFYDGPVEYDDLPSSKYHLAGDQRLGEVTSPFGGSIWGQDLGPDDPNVPTPGIGDYLIPAAGPYAVGVHGNFGRDAGNVLHMELLTWRTEEPFNNGQAWQDGPWPRIEHPYAGPAGLNKGFRDYNLDGMIDQGEVRRAGSENYIADSDPSNVDDGTNSHYPWNRRRLLEDCMAVLDDVIDFDDWVDTVTLDRVGAVTQWLPTALAEGRQGQLLRAKGLLSGIVLLPAGSHAAGDFPFSPSFYAIHNEDGLNDPRYLDSNFPKAPRSAGATFEPRVSWNLFVHDLVIALDTLSQSATIPADRAQTVYAAHEYLHTWEGLPDLYDYDVFDVGVTVNCPVGAWDIMSGGGLVHPSPILKELGSRWVEPIDLATVLTPGVDTSLTLPAAEFIRDESYYFLENDKRGRERLYFWSAGSGFDEAMPGAGLLIQHTDFASNLDAVPQQQRSADRPAVRIVQADGNRDLEACTSVGNFGDAGDIWPGSTEATSFNFETTPPATWYTQNSWTGLDVLDIIPDGSGSVQLKLNWVPTTIPSLRFLDPPGGQSVGSDYQIRFQATDVYGGTRIRMFYTKAEKRCSETGTVCKKHSDCVATNVTEPNICRYTLSPTTQSFIGETDKVTPGTNRLSLNWNVAGVANGRYALYAKLLPDEGADGTEDSHTAPRAGRNNEGNGTLTVQGVSIDLDAVDTDDKSRTETWTAVCLDPVAKKWRVNSTLTQPVLNDLDPDKDPYDRAVTGTPYTSLGGEVTFKINEGSVPFAKGDTITFTTTGFTAVSQSLTVRDGQVTEDPVAVIIATPLAGEPPLKVTFDARDSFDPNGELLNYRWDFGDGSATVTGSRTQHTYSSARTFTATLTVTNRNNGRFGEAAVDIIVTNNSPQASIAAQPTSGMPPLTVQFSAAQSSDRETDETDLVYQWDFGDGQGANDQGVAGIAFRTAEHFYLKRATRPDGTPCSNPNDAQCQCTATTPCEFLATLTVTDEGGKSDTDSVVIRVGNTDPIPVVVVKPVRGPAPLIVEFDARGSSDPDGDPLTVEWTYGDGATGTGLNASHTYTTPGTYHPKAVFKDGRQGIASWAGEAIEVTANQPPTAIASVDPDRGVAGITEFTFSAAGSNDPNTGKEGLTYGWDFGDGATDTGLRVTHKFRGPKVDGYVVTLTVTDGLGAIGVATLRVVVEANPGNRSPVAHISTLPSSCTTPCRLTFDGTLTFDADDAFEDLEFRWEISSAGQIVDTLIGTPVTRSFTVPGTYEIELEVLDGRGGADRDGPVTIIVTAPGQSPGEPPPGAGVPDDGDPTIPDSAQQRPGTGQLCGLGMVMSLFGSLAGLWAMAIVRRRWP